MTLGSSGRSHVILTDLGPFLIGILFALMGLPASVPFWQICGGLAVAALVCRTIYLARREAITQRDALAESHAILASIRPESAIEVVNNLSDSQLAARVPAMARQLRDLQERFTRQIYEASERRDSVGGLLAIQLGEWNAKLRPQAAALLEELQNRVDSKGSRRPRYNDVRFGDAAAIYLGSLAGGDALNRAALELERLARSLSMSSPTKSSPRKLAARPAPEPRSKPTRGT